MRKIDNSDKLGVKVFMELPLADQNKIITVHNEVLVTKFVYKVIELIKELAPVSFDKLFEEIIVSSPDTKKNDLEEIIAQLIDYEVLEIMEDVW